MRSDLDQRAAIHHGDPVAAPSLLELVRREYDGPVGTRALERRLDEPRALRIKRRGCLVEHEHRGVPEQSARDGHPLPLPA